MKSRKIVWSFVYLVLFISFCCFTSYVLNIVRINGALLGINYVWLLNAVSFCFGILMGLPNLEKVLAAKGKKSILAHRFIYIVPILLAEIWYNVPILNYPYASIFSNGLINQLLFVFIGFSLITIIDVKEDTP